MLTVALAAGAVARASQQSPSPATGAISGVIVDAVTGQVLAGSVVSLGRIARDVPLPPRIVTDSKGRFIFTDLPTADDYYVSARHTGYEASTYGSTGPVEAIFFNELVRIRVGPSQWVSDLKITLWKLPSISGRVVDERGEAAVGVAVRAFSLEMVAGREQIVGGPIGMTDDRGVYALSRITPGRYMVAVLSVQSTVLATAEEGPPQRAVGAIHGRAEGIAAGAGSAIIAPTIDVDGPHRLAITSFGTPPSSSSGVARAYVAQFYPGVRQWRDAMAIDVKYGDATAGIDFQIQPAPAFRVSGHTLGSNSPGLLLRLLPVGSESLGFGSEAATTAIEPDGSFTFLNVPSGDYTLVAQSSVMDLTTGSTTIRFPDAPGFPAGGAAVGSWNGVPGVSYLTRYGAGAPIWGRTLVSVGGQDIQGLALTLHPLIKISGRFAFAPGTAPPAASARLSIDAEPADGDPLLVARSSTIEPVDGGFRFTIDVLPGTHIIRRISGFRIVSVTAAGRDVTYSGVDVSDGRDASDVVVTLTDKRIALTGHVTGASGASVGVMAFPVDRERWTNYGWTATGFLTVRAGSDGAFDLAGLPAGDYFVVAVDASRIDSWTDQKFLVAVSPLATRITLGWGDTKTIDVPWRGAGK
jgi:hypothetical protein